MKKRLLSIILTLALCLSLLPTAALAAEGISVQAGSETVYYATVNEETGQIKQGNQRTGDILTNSNDTVT